MLTAVATTSVNCQTAFINIQMLAPVTESSSAADVSRALTESDNLTEAVI